MQRRHRTIAAPGAGAEAARAAVLRALAARPDLTVLEVAPGRIAVTRTTRPRWALVACAATFWLVGLGFLFLLVRRTEAGEISLTDGPRGCVVTVPPILDATDHRALEAALQGEGAASPPSAPSPPAPSREHDPADAGLEDRTVARSSVASPAADTAPGGPELVLRFSAGDVRVPPGASVVLGRDPSTSGPARGELVPGTGPDAATVSKSHLLVAFDGDVATVEDLGSTNGSTLVRDGGSGPLAPEATVPVAHGDELLLGAIRCVVLLPPKVAV